VTARRVLVLGGTGEGRLLAEALAATPGLEAVYSVAGRVSAPLLPANAQVRVGGFGGAEGLSAYLRTERVAVVADATHPFAATMTAGAVAAGATAGVPVIVLRRPGWTATAGDDWRRVPSLRGAAAALSEPATQGRRVFLTTGRTGVGAFAELSGHWFLLRSVEPPQPPMPTHLEVVLDRGPFTVDGEIALMRAHRVDVVVTKDSGGEMTAAKLVAARHLGLPIVMVDRPPLPAGARVVAGVAEAIAAVTSLTGTADSPQSDRR
jgi:precorrin-6A/cobalt-precorrin-6A reductase